MSLTIKQLFLIPSTNSCRFCFKYSSGGAGQNKIPLVLAKLKADRVLYNYVLIMYEV